MSRAWDPAQYERFRDERSRPFFDLLAMVRQRPGMRIADLGCGTGELTQHLHHQLQALETVGIDYSEAMLARSWEFAGDGLRFSQEDIGDFSVTGSYDLIISNAALQWVPHHGALLRRLTDSLAPGGQLAVQVPANFTYPAHTVALEVAAEAPFREALGPPPRRRPVLEPWEYAQILFQLGFHEQQVLMKVYPHQLSCREEVVEWVKGTLLVAYKERLPPELYEHFLGRYRQQLLTVLDDVRPFFYPFQRLFLWGQR
jgi:trans-aconitate 2-methyltransferase